MISNHLIKILKPIKAIFFDVDGVLTDGKITYTNDLQESKSFNVKDGLIIKHLKEAGFILGAITGRTSDIVAYRSNELKLDFVEQGIKDKWKVIEQKLLEYNFFAHELCYIGDDLNDLEAISKSGFGVTPSNAIVYIKDEANYISPVEGGNGVLRDVADLILKAQGKLDPIINSYNLTNEK